MSNYVLKLLCTSVEAEASKGLLHIPRHMNSADAHRPEQWEGTHD